MASRNAGPITPDHPPSSPSPSSRGIIVEDVLHHQHLIIESDSVNVIRWMNNPLSHSWKHHNLFSFVNRLKAYFGSITFSHIFRESNCMANDLAKQGVRRPSEFVAWI